MSIRLDPRRLGALKHLAGEAGVRPGDLVRQWVEERIDASRTGTGGQSLAELVEALAGRVAALEAASGIAATPPDTETASDRAATPADAEAAAPDVAPEPAPGAVAAEPEPESSAVAAEPEPVPDAVAAEEPAPRARRTRPSSVSAAPRERVALHDEMIAVIGERGPMTAGELAAAITERGRYAPPRSGKPLDAAMVSQRVSNPTYRARFRRSDGRIGLAEASPE